MQHTYLEVTFRHGRPLAAYYYLPRNPGQKSVRTRRVEPGMVIDYATNEQAIGIELTAPTQVSLDQFNSILRELGQPPITQRDLAPLRAA